MLKSMHTIFANVMDRDTQMPFGKYKGLTLAHILLENPKYLRWLFGNTDFLLKNKVDSKFVKEVFMER